jgi:hypothetical protein
VVLDSPSLAGDGAAFVSSHAGPDLLSPHGVDGKVVLLLSGRVEFRTQHVQGKLPVLKLGTFRLATNQHAGRQMAHLHGRVDFVAALAAWTPATACSNFQIGISQLDLFRSGDLQHGNGDGAGLDSAAAFVGGNSLPAMSACFVFKQSEPLLLAKSGVNAGLLSDQRLGVFATFRGSDFDDHTHDSFHCNMVWSGFQPTASSDTLSNSGWGAVPSAFGSRSICPSTSKAYS